MNKLSSAKAIERALEKRSAFVSLNRIYSGLTHFQMNRRRSIHGGKFRESRQYENQNVDGRTNGSPGVEAIRICI